MPTATNGDMQISYQTRGEGTPIIFLHGIFGQGYDWIKAGFDEKLLPGYLLIYPDLRGHGQSSKSHDPPDYLPEQFAHDIAAVLDHLGLDRAIVWGYSFGGRMCFAFALQYPQRVLQVVVGGMHPYAVTNVHQTIRFRQSYIRRGMEAWVSYLNENKVPASDYTKQVLLQQDHKSLVAMDDSILSWQGFGSAFRELCSESYQILLYLGSRDKSYIPLAKQYSERCDQAELIELPNLNHFTAFSRSGTVLASLRDRLYQAGSS